MPGRWICPSLREPLELARMIITAWGLLVFVLDLGSVLAWDLSLLCYDTLMVREKYGSGARGPTCDVPFSPAEPLWVVQGVEISQYQQLNTGCVMDAATRVWAAQIASVWPAPNPRIEHSIHQGRFNGLATDVPLRNCSEISSCV